MEYNISSPTYSLCMSVCFATVKQPSPEQPHSLLNKYHWEMEDEQTDSEKGDEGVNSHNQGNRFFRHLDSKQNSLSLSPPNVQPTSKVLH